MSDEPKSISVLNWDGKSESCPRYLVKITALAEYCYCGEALDKTEMIKCPGITQFTILSSQTSHMKDEEYHIELSGKINTCV